MTVRIWLYLAVAFLLLVSIRAPLAAQIKEPGGVIDMDGERFSPENPKEKAEFTFVRFHYHLGGEFATYFPYERWEADYPKADRQLIAGIRRLSRVNVRSTETISDAQDDKLYDLPWLYVEDPGAWTMTEPQAQRLRQYLLRGGFLMADDTHGDVEWERFLSGIRMIFPDRPIEELADGDELFHVAYDLDDRIQVPGTRYIWGYRRYTLDSATPHWRAIRDDRGRIMVAICHNSDVGDAWEWADSPDYPEHAASVAYRIGVNYIIYAMTH